VHVVKNIVGGEAQIERARFLDGDRPVDGHVEGDLARPLDNISSCVAVLCGTSGGAVHVGIAKCGGIEPFAGARVAHGDWLAADEVCA